MEFTFNLSQIDQIAAKVWLQNSDKKVWAFYGEMGAGKTTFIHALCKVLQIADTVSSPTFAIVNEYESAVTGKVFHMDWYRMKNEEEAIHTGIEDCIDSGNLCLIEWPEKAPGLLPDDTVSVTIEAIDGETRKLKIN